MQEPEIFDLILPSAFGVLGVKGVYYSESELLRFFGYRQPLEHISGHLKRKSVLAQFVLHDGSLVQLFE